MKEMIKGVVDELFELAAIVGKEKNENADAEEKKMRRLARKEIMNFLMYLSASDGSIEVMEAIFIKDYFIEQISPEEICQRIEEDNLYSAEFEQKIPLVLKKLVKRDNAVYEIQGDLEESKAEKYICLYELLGREFAACDHEISQSEKDDIATYIGNMRSFYTANYKGPESATKKGHKESFEKSSDTVRNQKRRKEEKPVVEDEETIDTLLEELNGLIGMSAVKNTVNQLIHFNAVKQIRNERGLDKIPMTMHMVFYGNPGTGKTTVARLIAKIYHKLGILSKGHLVEVDRSGLVAGYVGHTALKVKDVVKEAMGGVLFIDEAYALTYRRSENDFGWEAVDTLIKAMEDNREDLVIIVAGYPERMAQFIDSNPGLKSRFNRFINFKDYNGKELYEIFCKMAQDVGFNISNAALECAEEYFEEAYEERQDNFANARLVRNYLETSIMNQADRLYGKDNLSDTELCLIEYEDVHNIA